jgi:AcrR family transcriptional regulator
MRIAKDGEVRKQELMDAALDLFADKGYDNTSINDIIDRVGVTKGAFYYYFKSKEQVLDEIVEKFNEYDAQIFREVMAEAAPAVDKLIKMHVRGMRFIKENPELARKSWQAITSVGNTKIKHKHGESTHKLFIPILSELINQGIKEDAFDVPVPEETVGLLLNLYISLCYRMTLHCSGTAKECNEGLGKYLLFYQDAVEKLFGLKKGSLQIAENDYPIASGT